MNHTGGENLSTGRSRSERFFFLLLPLKKNGHWFMTFFRGQLCVCRMMKVYKQVFFCLHGEAVTDRKTGKLQITMMAPVTFCLVLAMCLVPGLE